jgi:hypothetical protein
VIAVRRAAERGEAAEILLFDLPWLELSQDSPAQSPP